MTRLNSNMFRSAFGGITRIPAIITRVSTVTPSIPSAITYWATSDQSSQFESITIPNAVPYDRPIPTTMIDGTPFDEATELPLIIPAKVGDACEIWTVGGRIELRNVPEKINMGPCQQ